MTLSRPDVPPARTPPRITVRPVELADHAARVTAALAALDQHALADGARRIAVAAPGSRSAPAAEALARRWESAVRAWAADAGAHGAASARSARDYTASDRDVAAALRAAR